MRHDLIQNNRKDDLTMLTDKLLEEYKEEQMIPKGMTVQIIKLIENTSGMKYKEIMSATRKHDVIIWRHTLVWLMCKLTGLGIVEIGRELNMDHSTVSNSRKVVNNMIDTGYHQGKIAVYLYNKLSQ